MKGLTYIDEAGENWNARLLLDLSTDPACKEIDFVNGGYVMGLAFTGGALIPLSLGLLVRDSNPNGSSQAMLIGSVLGGVGLLVTAIGIPVQSRMNKRINNCILD